MLLPLPLLLLLFLRRAGLEALDPQGTVRWQIAVFLFSYIVRSPPARLYKVARVGSWPYCCPSSWGRECGGWKPRALAERRGGEHACK